MSATVTNSLLLGHNVIPQITQGVYVNQSSLSDCVQMEEKRTTLSTYWVTKKYYHAVGGCPALERLL